MMAKSVVVVESDPPPPVLAQPGAWTWKIVEDYLREAADTIKRMPGRRGGGGVIWPEVVRDAAEAYGYTETVYRNMPPSAEAIDRMDVTLPWLAWLAYEDRQVVWARVNDAPWPVIAGRAHYGEKTVRRWYVAALMTIALRLNKMKVPMLKKY